MVLALFAGVLGAGCAWHDVRPSLRAPEAAPFSAEGVTEQPALWWTAFGDGDLNEQVRVALGGNYSLAASLERLRASRAIVRREASDLFPDLNGTTDNRRTFSNEDGSTRIAWGLEASYQVDLWGQIESRVVAERFRASATQADYQAAALTLSAEVARTWFFLIEAHLQLQLLQEQIETNRVGLEAQELRFGRGFVKSPDVFRQRQLLESTLEQDVVVRSRIEVLEHQLAVLQGRMPQTAAYSPERTLPELPPLPQTGLPADLVCRRPDIRRAYLAFAAADRDLAAAVTDQFPRLNLTGSLQNIADSPQTLFQDWFLSIGSQLVAPLFDGDQRRAEVDRNAAVVRQRFQEYAQAMLIAFAEVEDSLAQERYQRQRIRRLEAQVEWARKSFEQLREQYLIGDADYLDVLSAVTAQQRLQRETLEARRDLVLIRISLYLALAGDFNLAADSSETALPVPPVPERPGDVPEGGSTKTRDLLKDDSVGVARLPPPDGSVTSIGPPGRTEEEQSGVFFLPALTSDRRLRNAPETAPNER